MQEVGFPRCSQSKGQVLTIGTDPAIAAGMNKAGSKAMANLSIIRINQYNDIVSHKFYLQSCLH